MKKVLLSALFLGAASFAFAQEPVVVYEEDFEWLEPWSSITPAGQTVETNDPGATAQQLGTNKVDGVSTYEALLAKGYSFPFCCNPERSPRKPEAQTYLQRNYLKFGLTGYYSGMTFPKMTEVPDDAETTISFDWCSQRQGTGKWDPTELVVIVKNGDDEQQFLVPTHAYVDNEVYAWLPVSVELGKALKSTSEVTIRNIDSQWPSDGNGALRWFIDNIKVTAKVSGAAVEEIAVEAPAEYFNLQGVRVANPENGLYIVRKAGKVSKVLVK